MNFNDYLIIESINDVGILKCIFVAGQCCAGKSYTISKLQDGQVGVRLVNTDKMVEFFTKKRGISTDWAVKGDEIKTLTKKQLVLYLNSMLPLFIDGTSSNPSAVIRRQGLLESIGYQCGMVFVNASLETSIARVRKRDRKVPEELIRQSYEEVQNLLPFYKSRFSFFVEVDNNDGELTNDAILKAFRKTSEFFTSPLKNPLGTKVIKEMKANNWKYLADGIHSIEYLDKLASVWYKK